MGLKTETGEDGIVRCAWCMGSADYRHYHDHEWGYPVADDRRLFEKICLEGFQSGLSWLTILRKRDNFRAAFANFDMDRVAAFTPADVDRLLGDAGIIRHRGKIEAAINNAARAQELVAEAGSLAAFFWQFEEKDALETPQWRATSPQSEALSKALKKRGWRFVGPTTVYAFMQAMGLVNDHAEGCAGREKARAERAQFVVPGR